MIKLVDTDADFVLGVRLEENVLASDIELAMNFLEKKIRTRDKLALYVEIDEISDVESGVAMKELVHGFQQLKGLSHIERAAVVTDNESLRSKEGALGLLPTVDVKTFPKSEAEKAKEWVSQPLPG